MLSGFAGKPAAEQGAIAIADSSGGPLARGGFARRFALAAVLAALADWLFYNRAFGLSAAVFAVAIGAACALSHSARPWGRLWRTSLVLALAVLPLAAGPGVISVSFAVIGVAFAAVAFGGAPTGNAVRQFAVMRVLRGIGWRAVPDFIHCVRTWEPAIRGAWNPLGLLGWLVPTILFLVFLTLFADANPLIETGLADLIPATIFGDLDWLRGCFWFLIGLLVWPFLMPLEPEPNSGHMRALAARVPTPPANLVSLLVGKAAILRSLVLFNLLFALQTGLDLCYLWGGRALPHGLNYASYAHRGAYPLIVTALLAGAFAIAATTPGSAAAQSRPVRILVLLWVAQNLLLVASSFLRLHLYVQAYALSELRFAAFVWMLLVAAGLVLVILRIVRRRSNAWLIQANLAAMAAVLYICALVNLPGLVAMYDVRHCREVTGHGAAIDLDYLQNLGPQAIPALDLLERRLGRGGNTTQVFMQTGPLGEMRTGLAGDFSYDTDGWRGWDFWSWVLWCYLRTHQLHPGHG